MKSLPIRVFLFIVVLVVLLNYSSSVYSADSLLGEAADSWNVDLIGRWVDGDCNAVFSTGDLTYFGNGVCFMIMDCSDPANPEELGNTMLPEAMENIVVSGSYAYVADDNSGLRIIDVSNPAYPAEVGYYDTPGRAYGVAVSGSYAYVADQSEGLRIIDISNPAAPAEVGYYDNETIACGITISGSYAYLGDSNSLRILDVSIPESPTLVGSYVTLYYQYAERIVVSGSYAYVAFTGGNGLTILDVSIPESPTEVGRYGVPGQDLAVNGSVAYIPAKWD